MFQYRSHQLINIQIGVPSSIILSIKRLMNLTKFKKVILLSNFKSKINLYLALRKRIPAIGIYTTMKIITIPIITKISIMIQ